VGVAAAGAAQGDILIAGGAGLVAGAMSMAAGEYVSVSSQSDTEKADIARETRELAETPEFELQELTQIYVDRGLDQALARQVAAQLTAKDALKAHARDELGISEITIARPIQTAITSAVTFSIGAALPLLVVPAAPRGVLEVTVAITSLIFLSLLGAFGAGAGRASALKPVVRVVFWGAIAMLVTAGIGSLFGAVV
jgi:vacuolar iron transporter family protein